MVPLAVITVFLALTSALPLNDEVSDVQISNRPAVIDAAELAEQATDNEAIDISYVDEPSDSTVQVAAVHLPISVDFVTATDEQTEEPVSNDIEQVQAVHLPIAVDFGTDTDEQTEEPVSNDIEQVQAVHLPISVDFGTDEQTEEETANNEVSEVQISHRPAVIDASELAEQATDNEAIDISYVDEPSDSTVQVAAVHLPIVVDFGTANDEQTEEPVSNDIEQVQAVHLPIVVDFGTATDEQTEQPVSNDIEQVDSVEQVAAVHLPIFVIPGVDVASSNPESEQTEQEASDNTAEAQPEISISHLPAFVVPGVDVATSESENPNVQISQVPSFVFSEIPHDSINTNSDDSPCAACFAYMIDLIDQLTNSISSQQAVAIPNTKEFQETLNNQVIYQEIQHDDEPVVPLHRPALLQSLLKL